MIKNLISGFLGIILMGFVPCQAQDQQSNCAGSIILTTPANSLKVYNYEDNVRAEKIGVMNSLSLDSPEKLMSSVLSASSLEWFNYNREDKTTRTNQNFKYIEEANPDEYYFLLKYKLEFNVNGFDYAIIKHELHDGEKKPLGFAESMKKIGDRWYTTNEAGITIPLFLLGMVETKYLDHIFKNTESDNASLNEILAEYTVDGKLNLNGVLTKIQAKLAAKDVNLQSILDPNRLFK